MEFVVFVMYGLDKRSAKLRKQRTKESSLLLCATIMGGLGALIGMYFFRHKTQKWKFKIGVPFLFLINVGIIILFFYG